MKSSTIYNPVRLFTKNARETGGILERKDLFLEGPDGGVYLETFESGRQKGLAH